MINDLAIKIQNKSKEIGFDLIGFAKAKAGHSHVRAFKAWLNKDLNAGMKYMEKSEQRENLELILPEAKTVISLAVNYYYNQNLPEDDQYLTARYAYGRDYHKIIGKWLKELGKFIEELIPEVKYKAYVDTGPILERSFAEKAGLGVIGKNSCLITSEFGSWVLLSEIILDKEIKPPEPETPAPRDKLQKSDKPFNVCGACTRCIDACPTGAIIAPGVIDAKKCLSYLTIEHKGKIPAKYLKIIEKTKRAFGCDICQEVCPHNQKRQRIHTHPEFRQKIAGEFLSKKEISRLKTDEDFLEKFAGSPLMRPKRQGLQKNFFPPI